jgi:hypothetical protein
MWQTANRCSSGGRSLNDTHGLYVGIESRPRWTGDACWLKTKLDDLSPAERREGWTIAPIRAVASVPARTQNPVWLCIGAAIVVFLLFVLANVSGVHF